MTDLSKIKPGDEVTVRMVATSIASGDEVQARFRFGTVSDQWRLEARDIVSHTPKALSVGDRVKIYGKSGALIALHGRYAWVDFDEEGPSTEPLTDLRRA